MTIAELVGKHGLPVHVRIKDRPSWPSFIVHTETEGGWLVDSGNKQNHFVSNTPALDDYERKVVGVVKIP